MTEFCTGFRAARDDINEFGLTIARYMGDMLLTANPTHDYTAGYLDRISLSRFE